MSWQSTLLSAFMRSRRRRYQHIEDIHAMRRSMAKVDGWLERKSAKVSQLGQTTYGSVPVDTFQVEQGAVAHKAEKKVLLVLHGGAFCFHSPNTYRLFMAGLCQELGVDGLLPDYRLAPEHPHPAAIEDCLAVYRQLLAEGYRGSNILVVGDSAGGSIALSLLHLLKQQGLPMPACVALLSPGGDWSLSGDSFYENEHLDAVFHLGAVLFFRKHYLNGHAADDPVVSPLLADFDGYPPLFVSVSTTEMMRDIGAGVADKARQVDVPVELHLGEKQPHDFQIVSFLPEAQEVRTKLISFLSRYMG